MWGWESKFSVKREKNKVIDLKKNAIWIYSIWCKYVKNRIHLFYTSKWVQVHASHDTHVKIIACACNPWYTCESQCMCMNPMVRMWKSVHVCASHGAHVKVSACACIPWCTHESQCTCMYPMVRMYIKSDSRSAGNVHACHDAHVKVNACICIPWYAC